MNDQHKLTLTYYFDALCGWCYGFSPVISKIQNTFQNQINIRVISGGLFLGERAGRVNTVAPHIKAGAYKSVESMTGVKFGEPFLSDVFDKGNLILDSFPLAKALCIVKEKYPNKQMEFAEALLKAVYYDGMNPTNINEYDSYVIKIGYDLEEFRNKMNELKYKNLAEEEFKIFSRSSYRGMPALVAEKNLEEIPLTQGYCSFEELESRLKQVLNQL